MRLLVAEDSSLLRLQLTNTFLELDGVEVVGQEHGALAASRAIAQLKPDVVILDILMKDGSGIEVLRQIKGAECSPVVIVFTDNTDSPYRERAHELGADFLLDKSMDFGKMRETMRNLIQRFNKKPDSHWKPS